MASFMVEKHNRISVSPIKFQAQTDVKLINFSKWKYFFPNSTITGTSADKIAAPLSMSEICTATFSNITSVSLLRETLKQHNIQKRMPKL